jgi:hypothetical protein
LTPRNTNDRQAHTRQESTRVNLSKEEKKELQAQYKDMKPEMGIFAVINGSNTRHYLKTSQNLKGAMNSTQFILNHGSHPNQDLQEDWKKAAPGEFRIQILEQIEYDQDELKTDYSEELEILEIIWKEKLEKENIRLY